MLTKSQLKNISYKIIGCAIEVHKELGPGLLESVYHTCFLHELSSHGLQTNSQVYVPVNYKGVNLGGLLKLDLIVENSIIVEIKSVETLIPLYNAQLLSYLKLADKPKGLLINFNVPSIKGNVVSMVTDLYQALPQD